MVFKLNISEKGKAWKIEIDSETLVGRKIGDKINGKDVSQDLEGYDFVITGASDIAGFAHKRDVEGSGLRRVLLTKGWGMHKKPRKEGKKKVSTPKGLRLRKTVRGNQISEKTVQINLKVLSKGKKELEKIFPEQNKKEEVKEEKKITENVSIEQKDNKEAMKEKIEEEIKEEIKEEIEEKIPTSPETKTEEEKEEVAEKIAEEVVEESKEAIDKVIEDKN
jgi:small subunit ribosomal protein S6e